MTSLAFNPAAPTVMHIDINSCFATIEQQANPHLRGKPVAVAAYDSPGGCIVAPSVEAKTFGVKTGMRVKEGKALCPHLIVLTPDPWKYRNVHLALKNIVSSYTDNFSPKSIDEFVLSLAGYPAIKRGMKSVGHEIKQRIRREIGQWIRVSIGIAPNRFLAKVAASLHKPDGLDEINKDNYLKVYGNLKLTDLTGIKVGNALRLNSVGVNTVLDFYEAPPMALKAAFNSICSYYWYLRLRGWEIDDFDTARKSYGNSFALPRPFTTVSELAPILAKLVEKTGSRMRKAGYRARGVHLNIVFRNWSRWHKGRSFPEPVFSSQDIYKKAFKLLTECPLGRPVREVFVSVFNLMTSPASQLALFENVAKKESMVRAIDRINEHWGVFVIAPARMLDTKKAVIDRIAFGGVKELEEFTLN